MEPPITLASIIEAQRRREVRERELMKIQAAKDVEDEIMRIRADADVLYRKAYGNSYKHDWDGKGRRKKKTDYSPCDSMTTIHPYITIDSTDGSCTLVHTDEYYADLEAFKKSVPMCVGYVKYVKDKKTKALVPKITPCINSSIALYGELGSPAIHCQKHAIDGVDLKIASYCVSCGDEKPLYLEFNQNALRTYQIYDRCMNGHNVRAKRAGDATFSATHCKICADIETKAGRGLYVASTYRYCVFCCTHVADVDIDGKIISCATCAKSMNRGYKMSSAHYCECGKQAGFAKNKSDKQWYCAEHKTTDMYGVYKPLCVDCRKYEPSFNLPNKPPRYCSNCAANYEGFVNVKTAKYSKCLCPEKKDCSFGYPGGLRTRCGTCKEENMVLLKGPFCHCGKVACYSSGDITRCFEHKELGMTRTYKTSCVECDTEANFGVDGKRTHCSKHALAGMAPINARLCIKCNLLTANFGLKGGSREYCGGCASEDMIHLSRKSCVKCEITANFGYDKPTHCSLHREPDMKNMYKDYCINNCGTQVGMEGTQCSYCVSIYGANNDYENKLYQRRKEFSVRSAIEKLFPETFTFNKRIDNTTCVRRPDAHVKIGRTYICVEVDEFGHKGSYYEIDYEEKRYKDFLEVDGSFVFIRYNPDDFVVDESDGISALLKKIEDVLNAPDVFTDRLTVFHI